MTLLGFFVIILIVVALALLVVCMSAALAIARLLKREQEDYERYLKALNHEKEKGDE